MLVDALLSEPTCDTRQTRALVLGCLCIFAMGGLVFGVSAIYDDEYDVQLYADACTTTCPSARVSVRYS